MSTPKTIVLITGGNSGIGFATAKVITQRSSDHHVIIASRSVSKGEKAVAELKSLGVAGSLSTLQLNVTDSQSIAAAIRTIEQSFGRLDVLVNNAAVCETTSSEPDSDTVSSILLTNCMGPMLVTNAFFPLLRKSKNPYLINITSGMGSFGRLEQETRDHMWMYTTYRMSKSALNMLTLMQHKELGPKGVKVFGVCPGLVRSNLRGTDEGQITAGGNAGDPDVSGQTIFDIAAGKRDAEVGKFLHKDGIYPW